MRNNGEYELLKRHYDDVEIKNGAVTELSMESTHGLTTYATERYLKELDEVKGENDESKL
jgi:hypothetical protein